MCQNDRPFWETRPRRSSPRVAPRAEDDPVLASLHRGRRGAGSRKCGRARGRGDEIERGRG